MIKHYKNKQFFKSPVKNSSNQQNGKIKSLVSSDAEKDGKQQLGCLFMITGCLNASTPLESSQKNTC